MFKFLSYRWSAWRLSYLVRKDVSCLSGRLNALDQQIAVRKKALAAQERRLISLLEEIAIDLEHAKTENESIKTQFEKVLLNQAKYESEIESLRSELKIANEVIIPELTSAHRLSQQRWDTEVSIATKRQIGSGLVVQDD
jgi:hypothetical protein